MKILIGIIVAVVLIGGLVWFFSSDTTPVNEEQQNQVTDQLSESGGRVIDTDDKVFEEIDDAMNSLE